jgi:K+-sensing histidine kinase KdpD
MRLATMKLRQVADVRYAGAAVIAATALVMTLETVRYADRTPFVFFYVAVALTALYYGFGPALLATMIGIVGVTYFVLSPTHSLRLERPADALSLVAFAIVSYVASALTKSLRAARQRAEGAVATASHHAGELVRANEELWRVTADAERARVEADQARADAERANAAKSQFLAAMSHEIRTPINAVMGYAELLQEGIDGPLTCRQQDYVRRITVSSGHLSGLVSDLLDLAKVEAQRITVTREAEALARAVGESCTLVRPMADSRQLFLDCVCPASYKERPAWRVVRLAPDLD